MSKMWEYGTGDVKTLCFIEKQRRAYGMSQSELARRSGVSRTTIANIESGAIDPRISSVLRIVEQLGINLMPEFVGLPEVEE